MPPPRHAAPHSLTGGAVRPFLGRAGRRRTQGAGAGAGRGGAVGDGGGGGGGARGGRGGERARAGPGQRAAAAAGGAGARDRRGAAERRDGDPGAVQGEAQRAAARPAGGAVRGRRAEGGGGALRPDPLPDAGGHPAAPRGLQLRGAQGLPDGAEARRLRPPQAGGPRALLRADAGAVAPGGRRRAARQKAPSRRTRGPPRIEDGKTAFAARNRFGCTGRGVVRGLPSRRRLRGQ